MKRSDLKELIKKSMLEVSPTSGAMTPEEEEMVAGYEEEEANKYALDKEEPMEEASVILNHDEVYAKYAPLVKQYMKNGLDKHAAILKAQDVLAKEYGATPLNIQSTISDYFDDQDRNATYANENVLREADDIVAAYAEKKTIKEEMHGGYLELLEMNPDFEQGARLLLNAWFEWKEGPMTEPQMVEEAKQDILAYLSSMMK
jgi:hypothetical protein